MTQTRIKADLMARSHEAAHVPGADAPGDGLLLAPAAPLRRTGPPSGSAGFGTLPSPRDSGVSRGAGISNDFVRVPAMLRKLAAMPRMVTIAPPHRSA
jgi:hypothetical protein